IKNMITAPLKNQIVDALTEEARHVRQMARRLRDFTDVATYAVPEPTRWRSYRYQDLNLYANPYVEALNVGDRTGVAYDAVARTRSAAGLAFAALDEDGGAAEAALAAGLATLDLDRKS